MKKPSSDTQAAGELYRRAGLLFDELCELDETDRAAALVSAAEKDPEVTELAGRMLERDASPGPLGSLLPNSDDGVPQDENDPAGVLGTSIGPYAIEELLGRGGMGAVYLGRRREPDTRVAIKFITLSAAPATALERFRSEARLLARIEHPGVVRYRDSGIDRLGRPYLTMDFVDGEALDWSLPEIRSNVERTVAIAIGIAEAVHHLHQRRVLHRDLKPSNVLVQRSGPTLVPTIIDLGIARALADPEQVRGSANNSTQVPMTGTLGLGPVGTPAFMSPEQAQAGALPDVRTDVHALGALLFALLTGHPPRELDQVSTGDPLKLYQRLRETEAKAPSLSVDDKLFGANDARRRARKIDRDLDAVVLKAVALEPNERYGSAEAFGADLLRWSQGLPVTARLVGPLGRLRRFARRRPSETLLSLIAAILLVAGMFAVLQSRSKEIEARTRYQEQLGISNEFNRFFTEDVLQHARPELEGPEMPVIDLLRAAAKASAARVNSQPVVAVSIGGTLMEVFERLGASDEANIELERAEPIANTLDEQDPRRLLFEIQRGALYERRSQWDEAQSTFEGVLDALEKSSEPDPVLEARASNGLGSVFLSLSKFDEAEPRLNRALELFENQVSEQRSGGRDARWEVLANLAILKWSRGEHDETVTVLEELISAFENQFGDSTPFSMGIHSNLASLHLDRSRPNDALVHARKAVELAGELFEPTHPDRLSCLNQLASCLSTAKSFDEAIAMRREVYEGRLERFGADNSSVGIALNNLASTLVRADRPEEAREPAQAALKTLLKTLGDANTTVPNAYLTLAVIEERAGQIERALDHYDQAIAVYERAEGDQTQIIERTRKLREALAAKSKP